MTGKIVTMAENRPVAGGFAVRGGKLIYVGEAEIARRQLGPHGRLISLKPGQIVLPGLIDSHIHMLDAAWMRQTCVLEEPKTKEQLLATIAEYDHSHPNLAWVIGSGWPVTLFDEKGPTKEELDAVVSSRPAIFYGQDGHSAWVNSRALAVAKITKETPDPSLGRIERDASDAPTGTLREDSAVNLVDKYVPKPDTETWLAALREAQTYLHSLGITMVQDANVTPRMLEVYSTAAHSGILTMKVVAAQATDPDQAASQVDQLVQLRDSYSFGHLSAGSAKIFVDGVLESRTAALLEPYSTGSERGTLNWERRALAALATRLDREGFQMHLHAIGDQAARSALDAIEAAQAANGPSNNRHHIAHLELVSAHDMRRFRKLGVIANFQPYWMYADEWIKKTAPQLIGAARAQRLYPMASVARAGAKIVAGSDWPVSSPNPFLAIEVGSTRQSPEPPHGPSWIPSERVSRKKLLAAYTIAGAYVDHREHEAGSLENGKAADFIIIDRDILAIRAHQIGKTQVLNTFIDGFEVYRH